MYCLGPVGRWGHGGGSAGTAGLAMLASMTPAQQRAMRLQQAVAAVRQLFAGLCPGGSGGPTLAEAGGGDASTAAVAEALGLGPAAGAAGGGRRPPLEPGLVRMVRSTELGEMVSHKREGGGRGAGVPCACQVV